jgi:transposase-like protein
MPKRKKVARVFSRELKLSAVRRMLAGENVSALSRELGVLRKDLYVWRERFRNGGPLALRSKGRPRKSEAAGGPEAIFSGSDPGGGSEDNLALARRQIASLERKIGQQQLELDFFRQALRHVREARQRLDGSGVTASTRSSKR